MHIPDLKRVTIIIANKKFHSCILYDVQYNNDVHDYRKKNDIKTSHGIFLLFLYTY